MLFRSGRGNGLRLLASAMGRERVEDVVDGELTQVPAYALAVANALWGQAGFPFEDPFLRTLARDTTTDWVPRALARNIDLGFDDQPAAARVEGDAFMLREMLNNLIDNAVRYTQPGGHITVRVDAANGRIVLSVEDDGPGVPEPERERVFERFYRGSGSLEQEGFGLGLAIAQRMVDVMGGVIQVESEVGVGSTFSVRLPATAGTPATVA